ncbi:MAG: hypothetical protein Q8L00_07965, partial [Deltaproteobacteria bacterium]|nr:hypothetical protein [Deltaproteobacteria bacterium]
FRNTTIELKATKALAPQALRVRGFFVFLRPPRAGQRRGSHGPKDVFQANFCFQFAFSPGISRDYNATKLHFNVASSGMQGMRYTTERIDRRKGDESFMHPVILVSGVWFGLAGHRVA